MAQIFVNIKEIFVNLEQIFVIMINGAGICQHRTLFLKKRKIDFVNKEI